MGQVIQVGFRGRLQPTITLTFVSTLRQIRDKGNVLYNHLNAQDYKECQDDIQAVSGIAGDIQEAVLDYQVCRNRARADVLSLKFYCFYRWHSNERYTSKIVN